MLDRLLRNSLSTETAAAAAMETLPIRDRAEKNVGCMPYGLCHFRRGLPQLFRAFLLCARPWRKPSSSRPRDAAGNENTRATSPLFLTRNIYWQVFCTRFAPSSGGRDFDPRGDSEHDFPPLRSTRNISD